MNGLRRPIPCTGVGPASFHEWTINIPDPMTGTVPPQMIHVDFQASTEGIFPTNTEVEVIHVAAKWDFLSELEEEDSGIERDKTR